MSADQPLLRRTLARMDEAWTEFRDAFRAVPIERLGWRIGEDGWSRRQMLAHIGVWHDLTAERLSGFAAAGRPPDSDEPEDLVNARAARSADGRTTGELLLSLDDSYRRLRREVERLTDDQLGAHEGWALAVIAGNSFDHYAEHLADLAATAT